MSRCFPFPPPGYPGIEESSLTLIESIKLQREWEPVKAKAKKDRKREKKERKKEKKVRKEKKEIPKSVLPDKSSTTNVTSLPVVKLLETENDQLERSSLTEEHAIQASEQKPSTSSDSTHTSSKRKREEVNSQVNSIRGTGNVIRIRLSSRKQNAEVSKPDPCATSRPIESPSQKQNAVISRQQPCSTSGRTQLTSCNKHQGGQVDVPSVQQGNNNVISVRLPKPEANRTCSPLPKVVTREGNTAAVSQFCENKLPILPPIPEREASSALVGPKVTTREDDIIVRDPKSLNKKLVKADLRYKDLFSSWVPPPPQRELEPDDQDWLFVKKHPDNRSGDKKLKPSNIVVCGSSSLLFPRAQFIPEADIYALPFTVPF